MSIIYSVFIFLLVILVHEFGHFVLAKINGIQVNEFSIGMGPSLISWQGRETQYTFRLLPIGGYVAMEGEEEVSSNPRSFNNASPLKRISVIAAGALMNFLLAIVLFNYIFYTIGTPSTEIDSIVASSPAENAGILPGDKILSINDVMINEWPEITNTFNKIGNKPAKIEVLRNGEKIKIDILAKEEKGNMLVGIYPKRKALGGVFTTSIKQTIDVIEGVFVFISQLIIGKANVSDLSGPIGIVRQIGRESSNGIVSVLFMAGVISANLGAFNLLPIPALDGGTILLTLIEMVINRKVPDKIKIVLNIIGLSLLLGLMLYVTIFNDILNIKL